MKVVCVVAKLKTSRPRFYVCVLDKHYSIPGMYVTTIIGDRHSTMISAVLWVRRQLRARYMQQWNRRIDADVIRLPVGVCS